MYDLIFFVLIFLVTPCLLVAVHLAWTSVSFGEEQSFQKEQKKKQKKKYRAKPLQRSATCDHMSHMSKPVSGSRTVPRYQKRVQKCEEI